LRSLSELDRPALRAALPALPGLNQRWKALKKRSAPYVSPAALATSLVLGGSLMVGGFCQFFTGLFEAQPALSTLSSLVNAALAGALGVQIALRPPFRREHAAIAAVAGLALLVSLGSLGAKLQYQRGLAGNPFYSLPHQAIRYPEGATDVLIRTSDGVRLTGTLLSGKHAKAVLIYPTWRSNRDGFAIATLAQWLGNSYDVLVLDPRGQGGSGGAKSPSGDEKFDVLAGVAFLRASGHERVGVLAEQEAAYPAILAAGAHQGIDSLALVAPTANWGETLGHQGRLWDPHGLPGRLFWRVAAGLRLAGGPEGPTAIEAIRQASPTPLLLCAPNNEPGSTLDQLHMAAAEPKSMMIYGGEGRPTKWSHFADYYQTIDQWFDLSLRAPEAPAAP
jgi:hypothetical protein